MHKQRMIFDSIDEGMVGIDEQGIVDFFNKSAVEMIGFPIEEAIGKNDFGSNSIHQNSRVYSDSGKAEVNRGTGSWKRIKIVTSRFPLSIQMVEK